MRISLIAIVAVIGCSCQNRSTPEQAQPGTTTELASRPLQLTVGDPWKEARERILASGGRVYLSGMYMWPGRAEHFDLKDGTGLRVHIEVVYDAQERIRGLTLGEQGRGHIDKVEWMNQKKRDVTRVILE
jgi:hypothetical protein